MENQVTQSEKKEIGVARAVAPEDLRSGGYVAILSVVCEILPFWRDESFRPLTPYRTVWLPPSDAGVPLRIREICLPFVLVEQPDGKHRTLDVRRFQLAMLSERYGEKGFKKLRDRQTPPRSC